MRPPPPDGAAGAAATTAPISERGERGTAAGSGTCGAWFLLGRVGVSTLPTGGPRPVPVRSPAARDGI